MPDRKGLAIILIVCLLIPVVAASDTVYIPIRDSNTLQNNFIHPSTGSQYQNSPNSIRISSAASISAGDKTTLIRFGKITTNNPDVNANQTTMTIGNYATGQIGYYRDSQGVGYVYLECDWHSKPPTNVNLAISCDKGSGYYFFDELKCVDVTTVQYLSGPMAFSYGSSGYPFAGEYTYNTHYIFANDVIASSDDSNKIDEIDVIRNIDGIAYESRVIIAGQSGEYIDNRGITDIHKVLGAADRPYTINVENNGKWYNNTIYASTPVVQPCTINVFDADSRLPLSGAWDYYVVVQGADAVSGSASGAFTVVNLPVTSILKPHLLYVTKEGYEMTPGFVAIDVPAGGREINIYLTPLETTAPDNSSVVTFSVTDIESGAPVHSALVNVDGVAKYVGASGTAWFILPENTTHEWVVTSQNHWPIGGNFTLGVDDLAIPVSLTRKTSDLPRPPLPELPNFPVIHPSLDPAGFRMQILSVPLLGSLASPLLDTVDSLGVGLNDMATAVLDVLTAPADYITGAVSSVGQNLIDTATPYLVTSSLLLQVIGAVISCIPGQVCGLVTFGLLLDIVRILLWGPA